MTMHDVVLTGREKIADGTLAFHFRKPAGFLFKPGQAIDLVLATPAAPDAAGLRHTFSLVSAPFEDVVTIATRMRDSAFKHALASLPVGSPAALEGPFGSLTLHSNPARPAVFLAGGIGVTPFISILRQAARDQLSHRFTLVHSNRRPEDAAFLSELQALERTYRNFQLVSTMTRMNGVGRRWPGRTGQVDRDLIGLIKREQSGPVYYLAGAPSMVAGLRQLLANAAIDDDDVRSEDFFGY